MYKEYFLEEYGKETFENQYGFFTYVVNMESRELFVEDFFILPQFRKTLQGKKMFTKMLEIARENKCDVMTGIISLGVKPKEVVSRILKCYLSVGFHVVKASNSQMLIAKQVDDE